MQPTVISSDDGPIKSAFGEIVHRGWLNLKTRSMVNVRPRHMRYCILSKDTNVLSTFKFQPSSGDLTSGFVQPLRAYRVLGVAPWDGRRFAFLISAVNQADSGDRVLEADAPTAPGANEWIHHLRVLTNGGDDGWPSWPPPAPVPLPQRPSPPRYSTETENSSSVGSGSLGDAAALESKRQSNLWVKGASVHRGLLNASGENNCFLNVVIQVRLADLGDAMAD